MDYFDELLEGAREAERNQAQRQERSKFSCGIDSIEFVRVIKAVTTMKDTSDGTIRRITSYWSEDGELLATDDPCVPRREYSWLYKD